MPHFCGHTHTKRDRRASSLADGGGYPDPGNAFGGGGGSTSSGLSAGEAVRLLSVRIKEPQQRALCAGLWERISEGAPLSRAMAEFPDIFDPSITNPFMQVDDGASHQCNLGDTYSNNTPPPAGTYQINALPPSSMFAGKIRVCITSTPGYSPQCSYRQLSPAYTPVTVASAGTAVANFCLGNLPVTTVGGLLLNKAGSNINFIWNSSPDLFHDHYRIYQAGTARPTVGGGTFPGDPFSSYFDVFSGTSTSQPGGPATLFYLVVDTGITGTPGPSGSYGN